MLGACWWSAGEAVAVGSVNQIVTAIAMSARFPGVSLMVGAFVCLGLAIAIAIAMPQWIPRRGLVAALLVEPVLITVAAATNPWHPLLFRQVGAPQLTGSGGWTFGPVFWVHTCYSYVGLGAGVALIAWSWWTASSAFRAQRLVLLAAVLPPFAVSIVYVSGGFGDIPDPTALCFAVTGTMMADVIFRQGLFTFSPGGRSRT